MTTTNCLHIGTKTLHLDTPKVMGIVNLTPDSFFDGGNYIVQSEITQRIDTLIDEGADIIDLGAYSTRPNAAIVSPEEEWKRLEPALAYLKENYPNVIVSVDTFRSQIAEQVRQYFGEFILNDISGGTLDAALFAWVGKHQMPYILMHIQGTPQTMQQNPSYENIVQEVYDFLYARIQTLRSLGAKQLIIDLGFGFGKTIAHNYTLLRHLATFHNLKYPILTGISRKSMIYKLLDTTPAESLNGSTVLHTMALERGSKILRVHDVKEAKEAVKLYLALQNS